MLLPAALKSHRYLAAILLCVATMLLVLPFRESVDIANIDMLFLLAVFVSAIWLGRGPAVIAVFLSVALFDFFFVPPYLSFAVADAQYLITFAVMLTVGLLLQDPAAIENPFYRLAPEWLLLPMVGLATMATVIASQAVISGAFSITQQAIQLGFAPRMEISHTSDEEKGQIYLPSINWTLLLAVIALVVGFHSSSNLAAAYGIAVTGTMFITDILAFMVARYVWGWPVWKAFLGALPFALIDIGFFSANTIKIADGGWFPLVFGLVVYLILSTWKRGRDLLKKRLMADAMDIQGFVNAVDESITRVPGTAVFLTANPQFVPQAMLHSMKHYKVLHERIVIVSVSIHDVPRLDDSKRVTVVPMKQHFWQVKLHYGFMERPNIPEALEWCAESGLDFNPMDTSFFLGRETLIPRISSEMCFWREKVFVAMFRNAGSAAQFFGLPPNRVVELGTQVVL